MLSYQSVPEPSSEEILLLKCPIYYFILDVGGQIYACNADGVRDKWTKDRFSEWYIQMKKQANKTPSSYQDYEFFV